MADIQRLEERIAHLIRQTDELSEVVARQEREIATLARRVAMLMEREAERELAEPPPVGRPPHW